MKLSVVLGAPAVRWKDEVMHRGGMALENIQKPNNFL